jgi:RsmE family RNA methyltransferase
VGQPQLVAIGPEGGFIPYEVSLLQAAGLKPVSLGARILRVETAVAVALGKLLPLI